MAKRPDKTLPAARFHELMTDSVYGPPRWAVERIWTTAPPSYFASDRDHRRWNQRFAGKPVAETPGAVRVRLVEMPRGFKRWHVEIVVGVQRFSLSSHDDRKEAEWDAGLFGGALRGKYLQELPSRAELGLPPLSLPPGLPGLQDRLSEANGRGERLILLEAAAASMADRRGAKRGRKRSG